MAIFTFGTTVLSVKGTYELLSKRIQMNVINKMGFLLFVSTSAGDKLSILVKILTNYFQIIGSLTSFSLPIPSTLT